MSPTSERPQHDPLAESVDLLTHQEAAARFWDAAQFAREEAERLEAAGASPERLEQARTRVHDLEAAANRVAAEPRG